MKSKIWKNLVVLFFIISIGSYVAYSVGAFDKFFTKKKNETTVNNEIKQPDKNKVFEKDDTLMYGSKSAPFDEIEEEELINAKQSIKKNQQEDNKLMPGSKSKKLIKAADEVKQKDENESNKKQNLPKTQQKNSFE